MAGDLIPAGTFKHVLSFSGETGKPVANGDGTFRWVDNLNATVTLNEGPVPDWDVAQADGSEQIASRFPKSGDTAILIGALTLNDPFLQSLPVVEWGFGGTLSAGTVLDWGLRVTLYGTITALRRAAPRLEKSPAPDARFRNMPCPA